MAYKIIDGVVYQVEEVKAEDLEKVLDVAIAEVERCAAEKEAIAAKAEELKAPFERQLENYQKQIDGLKALIDTVKEKEEAVLAEELKKAEALDVEAENAKQNVLVYKDVLMQLFPEKCEKLGL